MEWIIFPKDKTRNADPRNRTLDPQIQSLTLYRLSQQAPPTAEAGAFDPSAKQPNSQGRSHYVHLIFSSQTSANKYSKLCRDQ